MDNNEVCSYFEQYQNGHEFKIGRHNREVLILQQKQFWDDICTVESNLAVMDFTTCPPTQFVIDNQLLREKYGKGKEHEADWLHANAAGITPEG